MDFILTTLFLLLASALRSSYGIRCCQEVPKRPSYSACKDACNSLWMSSGPLQQLEILPDVYKLCDPDLPQLNNLWQCINENYHVTEDVQVWSGRACCELASSLECQLMCKSATSKSELESACPDLESNQVLKSCLRHQQDSADCCQNTDNNECLSSCRAVFVSESPDYDAVTNSCSQTDRRITQCVRNWSDRQQTTSSHTASLALHCCERGSTAECQQTCVEMMSSNLLNETVKIQQLVVSCGEPVSEDPMWKCFLLAGDRSTNQITDNVQSSTNHKLDGASIQCCNRANSVDCRNLCIEMYSRSWDSVWQTFSSRCQYKGEEQEMIACIQEVEEPCQIGCDHLEFCSNFNNKIDQMYRTCNERADSVARHEYERWVTQRRIQLPTVSIPIKDVLTCQPDMWKAISCSLQIKPCNTLTHSNKLCKSDCMYILEHCIDNSEISYDIGALCNLLPVTDNQVECISLAPLIEVSAEDIPNTDLKNPCIPNPCNVTQICHINVESSSCGRRHAHCEKYKCVSACSVGESSPLSLPVNSIIKLPDLSVSSSLLCEKVCKCGHLGFLTHCKEFGCVRKDICYPGTDQVLQHDARSEDGCNQCICKSGHLICSKRRCSISINSQIQPSDTQLIQASLPCNCETLYHPVCTTNGRVFANSCLAQCAGFSDISYEMGNCASKNPCGDNPCRAGSKCVPNRRVCMDSQNACPQYKCIAALCNTREHDIVCDTLGMQHPNVCTMLLRRRQIGYSGKCLTHCTHYRSVCGVDGEAYANECTALASRVAVDYHKHCSSLPLSVSLVIGVGSEGRCSYIECTRSIPAWCQSFIPPGACCPVCGAMLRVLNSENSISRLKAHTDSREITPKDVGDHLYYHLSTVKCDLYSYISVEHELIVLITPTDMFYSQLEVVLCRMNAHRLHYLIETSSPIFLSDVILSTLLKSELHLSEISEIIHPTSSSTKNQITLVPPVLILIPFVRWISLLY